MIRNWTVRLIVVAFACLYGCDSPVSTLAPTPGTNPIDDERPAARVLTGDTVFVDVRLYRETSQGATEMIGRSSYRYRSTNSAVVVMLGLGYALAVGPGIAEVVVSSEGVEARYPIEVVAASAPAPEAPTEPSAGADEPAGTGQPTETEQPAGSDEPAEPEQPAGSHEPVETDPSTEPTDQPGGSADPSGSPVAPEPPIVADIEVFPGDDLVSIVNSAPDGSVIYLHGLPDGSGYTYEIGDRVLSLPHRATIRGPTATRGPRGEIHAPVRIHGSGKQIFNQHNRNGWTIEHLDISGARFVEDRNRDGVGIHRGFGTIRYVKVHDNDNIGVGGWAGVLEYSELTNNSAAQISGHSAASKSIRVHTIRNTYVHHNHYYGLWTDCDNSGWTVEDNLITDNFGSGIFNEISRGPSIIARNRVLRNNLGRVQGRGGLVITSSTGVQVIGNMITDNGVLDVKVWEDHRAGNGAAGCQSGYRTENVTLLDNLIGSM